jgi:hypothetical protein
MRKDLAELVFILDRSGSMQGLENDTIGGFNALLAKQKAESGEALVTTALFDDKLTLLHDRIDIRGVRPITDKEYFVRGSTALLDALGAVISKIINAHRYTDEALRPGKVIFFITTDGQENASHEYSLKQIRGMIERQRDEFQWEFVFLGANIDAVAEAEKYGIRRDRTAKYAADATGTQLNYSVMSEMASNIRADIKLEETDWQEKIQEYERNNKKSTKK